MTPVTGATFPTAMRRSVPYLGAERQRRTSIMLSADAGRSRLVSRVPLRPRCRKSGSVLGWRAPDHRLTAGGLGPRGSGLLLKGVGRQPPASRPASEASSRRSRALIRPRAERQLDSRSIATQRRECCSNEDCLVGFRRARWLRHLAACERSHRSAASVRLSRSAAGDPSGRSLASARSRLAVGGPAPSALNRSAAGGRGSRDSAEKGRARIQRAPRRYGVPGSRPGSQAEPLRPSRCPSS